MKEKNILVACSSLDYILIHKLLHKNLILDKADTKEELLRLGKSKGYNLFLIDVSYLKPDFEVLSLAKERNIPVVALSSEPYDAKDGRMEAAGCRACYIKPIRSDLFVSFVTRWIRQPVGE